MSNRKSTAIPLEIRFLRYISPPNENGCILWTGGKYPFGYGMIGLKRNGSCKTIAAHRVSWELANGPIPEGLFVLHKCDVPACVAVEHLFLGTYADNTADMLAKGRGKIGLQNVTAKLTPDDVRAIRNRYAEGNVTREQLGDEYGVTANNIWYIIRRKSWAHIV